MARGRKFRVFSGQISSHEKNIVLLDTSCPSAVYPCKKQSNERGTFFHCVDEVYANAAAGGWYAYRGYTIEDGINKMDRCHAIAKAENEWLNQEKTKAIREENIKERERLKAKQKS
jgi:hypothetical protein